MNNEEYINEALEASDINRYMVFFGADYYASGGLRDFVGSFDSLNDALKVVVKQVEECPHLDYELVDYHTLVDTLNSSYWAHIYDVYDERVVFDTKTSGWQEDIKWVFW